MEHSSGRFMAVVLIVMLSQTTLLAQQAKTLSKPDKNNEWYVYLAKSGITEICR